MIPFPVTQVDDIAHAHTGDFGTDAEDKSDEGVSDEGSASDEEAARPEEAE